MTQRRLFAASFVRPWAAGLLALCMGSTDAWARDVAGTDPPKTEPDLLVHKEGTDLSAFRVDCDVFGWDRKLSQVAAVGTDVVRGPRGRHRGEAALLVYEVGHAVPLHNVRTATITHADLPKDPVPLDDARDIMWSIENSYLAMWPVRPKYKRPKRAAQVDVLYRAVGSSQCTPNVGFTMSYHGQHRYVPFLALDMHAGCSRLRKSDARTYWANNEVTASMVRFDFSDSATNEKSARFVVSAAWKQAKDLNVVLELAAPLDSGALATLTHRLEQFGHLRLQQLPREKTTSGEVATITDVGTQTAYDDLGQYLADALHAAGTRRLGHNDADVVVHVGYASSQTDRPPSPVLPSISPDPNKPAPQSAGPADPDGTGRAAAAAELERRHLPQSSMPPTPTPPQVPADNGQSVEPSRYLKDWQP